MADKAINELPAASVVQAIDLFVLEQNATAKKLAGSTLEQWLLPLLLSSFFWLLLTERRKKTNKKTKRRLTYGN